MNPKFTIFTPSYNRAHTLSKAYESLVAQTDKDFEWIVVDDGSKDKTKGLVEGFISENKIKIRYIFQENQGKHIAINTGLMNAQSECFLVLDSDDFLLPNCIEISRKISEKISKKNDFAGFTFIRFSEKSGVDFKKYGKNEWVDLKNYHWEFPGEMGFVYKTEIAKQFLFPKFEGERFCPESVVYRRIARKYHVLFTDHILAFGEYLEDGLTRNYYDLLKKNPRAAMLSYKEKIDDAESFEEKKQLAKSYWNIANSASNIGLYEKISGISLLLSVNAFKEKILKKLRK